MRNWLPCLSIFILLECFQFEVILAQYYKKSFGEDCKQWEDCKAAFSECTHQGKCSCQPGFTKSNGNTCKPKKYFCNAGTVMKVNNEVQHCEILKYRTGANTCPPNTHCEPYGDEYMTTVGHCCSTAVKDYNKKQNLRCPFELEDRISTEYFCPRPCPFFGIVINGHCYQRMTVGGDCTFDQQCKYYNAGSCQNGKCSCPSGQKADGTGSHYRIQQGNGYGSCQAEHSGGGGTQR